jgi:hypothetical protein
VLHRHLVERQRKRLAVPTAVMPPPPGKFASPGQLSLQQGRLTGVAELGVCVCSLLPVVEEAEEVSALASVGRIV